MTAVIKNGTIVTAELIYKAGVKVNGGISIEIGPELVGANALFHATVEAAEVMS